MRLLAAGIVRPWRQLQPYLNRFGLQVRMMGSPNGHNELELAGALHGGCADEHPMEEAITDGLTGLKTRRYFIEGLDEEWRRSTRTGRQFCLAMVDLDRFKQVNDRMGHLEGDKVLRAVAALLVAGSKQPNVVARYGEDEFAILMPQTNAQQAETLAEGLRAAVEADDFLRAHEVTVSFGIAAFPDHGRTHEEILKVAHSGMDLAKNCNGNCVKVASLSPNPGNAERNAGLLDAHLEAAAKGTLFTARDTFSQDQNKLEQTRPLFDTITALAFAVEAKDAYRQDHSQAVSKLAVLIAMQAGLYQAEVEEIRLAGIAHDIGKIHVPESVYNKPDLLTGEEFEMMRSHAACGAKILEHLNVKGIEHIVRHHHERYDGKGYPDGLAGEKIPLGARIVAVAECFHNMISDLPYKSTCTFEDALDELRRCSGTQFDPKVVTAFLD
jgi:diguanylate cyclase (GGDEF)-like protein/putative nucleotidyltransferase with HDIG domain